MNYKALSKVLKYYHEDFHSVLDSMKHDDWLGNEKADHTKRQVLADLYKEWMGSQGRDEEADSGVNSLMSGHPAIFHENRIKPAKLIVHNLINTHSNPELNDATPEERLKESLNPARYDPQGKWRTAYTKGEEIARTNNDIEHPEKSAIRHSTSHPINYHGGWGVRKEKLVPESEDIPPVLELDPHNL